MAVTASGLYGLSLEKMMIDTLGQSIEAETHKVADGHRHGGAELRHPRLPRRHRRRGHRHRLLGRRGDDRPATEVTLSVGVLTFDATDVSWATSTIANAMAAVFYTNVGSRGDRPADLPVRLRHRRRSSSGTFTIQWSAGGIFTLDYTP